MLIKRLINTIGANPSNLAYEQEIKRVRDHKAMLDAAEDKGVERGLLKGREEGRQEERLGIAKNLLAAGVDLDVIKKTTHLSDEELADLRVG